MTIKEKVTNMLTWGFVLWLVGYIAGFVLFFVVPKDLIGWIITPFATLFTTWVLMKKVKRPEMMCYFGTGLIWTIMAVVLDYLFNVVLLKIGMAYYRLDVFLYYFLTFTLPILVGYWKYKHKTPKVELFKPGLSMSGIYNDLFATFSGSLEAFIREVKCKKSSLMATDEWTVKDELCHIVFWHENYAANYKALAEHKDPPLPKGMSTINMAGVLSLRKYPTKDLIARLYLANKSLYKSIVEKKVPRMTYSKGGRTYETAYFLDMIARHINTHAKQVRRAKEL